MQLRIEKSDEIQAVTAEVDTSVREVVATAMAFLRIPGTAISLPILSFQS